MVNPFKVMEANPSKKDHVVISGCAVCGVSNGHTNTNSCFDVKVYFCCICMLQSQTVTFVSWLVPVLSLFSFARFLFCVFISSHLK